MRLIQKEKALSDIEKDNYPAAGPLHYWKVVQLPSWMGCNAARTEGRRYTIKLKLDIEL